MLLSSLCVVLFKKDGFIQFTRPTFTLSTRAKYFGKIKLINIQNSSFTIYPITILTCFHAFQTFL